MLMNFGVDQAEAYRYVWYILPAAIKRALKMALILNLIRISSLLNGKPNMEPTSASDATLSPKIQPHSRHASSNRRKHKT